MKVTGYLLRQAIKHHELRAEAASQRFAPSFRAFKDEDKQAPLEVLKDVQGAELAIAKLQVAQTRYNLQVSAKVGVDMMTLAEAIKRLGGAQRVERLWRSVAGKSARRSHTSLIEQSTSRSTDVAEVAKLVMTHEQAVQHLTKAVADTEALRSAIGTANATELDIAVDPAVFDR